MKKIISLIFLFAISILGVVNSYASNVDDALKPLKGDIEKNVTSLTTVIFIMLGIFLVLALIEAIVAGKKNVSTKIMSNKGIRFLEVMFLIALLVLLVYEYIRLESIVIKAIGIILSLFAFYQRVSNKNRRWAYITLTLDMLLYIGINIF